MLQLSNISIVAAFAAGTISFLSPCVLPLVPGYISYIAGQNFGVHDEGASLARRLPVLGLSFCFVLGFSTVFLLLGASATALGQLLLAYRYELNIAGGAMIILFGLFMVGVVRFAWLQRDLRIHISIPGGKPLSAYLLGLAFAFGWTPCIGPILGAILTVSAASSTVGQGIALLGIYSLGLGVPFLLTAAFTNHLLVKSGRFGRAGRLLNLGAGGLLIVMGIAMITGHVAALAYWLLDAFPILAEIG